MEDSENKIMKCIGVILIMEDLYNITFLFFVVTKLVNPIYPLFVFLVSITININFYLNFLKKSLSLRYLYFIS